MTLDNSSLLLLSAPAAMLLVSLAAIWRPAPGAEFFQRLSVGAAAFGIYVAAIGVALLINHGPMHSTSLGWPGFGLSVRIEPLSILIFSLISLSAFYCVRLSRRHMAGDRRRVPFLGRLNATIASIQLLLLTGHPGMMAVAAILAVLTLYELLPFYRGRRGFLPSPRAPRIGDPRGI